MSSGLEFCLHGGLRRLPKELRNYCVYTNKSLYAGASNSDHVIPKKLGGNQSTLIRADKSWNSNFGSQIEERIAHDPLVSFGVRETQSRGHGNQIKNPRWKGAVRWTPDMPLRTGIGSFELKFPQGATFAIDCNTGTMTRCGQFGEPAFVIWDLQIDHIARLKFTLKTLLGIGWKFFQEDFLKAVDVAFIRRALTNRIALREGATEGWLSFSDGFLEKSAEGRAMEKRLQKILVRRDKTSVMLREQNGKLNWSIACLGYFVGSVWLPLTKSLLGGDLSNGNGLLLVFNKTAFDAEVVPSYEIDA